MVQRGSYQKLQQASLVNIILHILPQKDKDAWEGLNQSYNDWDFLPIRFHGGALATS